MMSEYSTFATYTGSRFVSLGSDENPQIMELKDTLYVEGLAQNLFSTQKARRAGFVTLWELDKVRIVHAASGVLVGTADYDSDTDEMALLHLTNRTAETAYKARSKFQVKQSLETWHRRMGHLNTDYIKLLADGKADSVLLEDPDNDFGTEDCDGCIAGKWKHQPGHQVSNRPCTELLEIVSGDLSGIQAIPDVHGNQYFGIFVDRTSRFVQVDLYKEKTKELVFANFYRFVSWAERQSGKKSKLFRSDGGGEFMNKLFKDFTTDHGIHHESTNPGSSWENGVSERTIGTIQDRIRCMIHASGLEPNLWGFAALNAGYLQNRSPNGSLGFRTPYEVWYGRKPDLSHIRVFGSPAYAYVGKEPQQGKLDPKCRVGIFVGYPSNKKGYILWDNHKKEEFVKAQCIISERFEEVVQPTTVGRRKRRKRSKPADALLLPSDPAVDTSAPIEPMDEDVAYALDNEEMVTGGAEPTILRRSARITANAATAKQQGEPKGYAAAISQGTRWIPAMDAEVASLIENKVFEFATLPSGRKAIKPLWVYKEKTDAEGNVCRLKARCVARGFTMQHGVDYFETYSPVMQKSSLRFLVSFAAMNDLEAHGMDIVTAFLYGIMDDEVYMEVPPHYPVPKGNEGLVLRLKKGLYGTPQAGRLWYKRLHDRLQEMGFVKNPYDHAIYIRKDKTGFAAIGVYVDDILIICSKDNMISIKGQLAAEFKCTDQGPISFILGIRFERNLAEKTINLDQTAYIEKLFEQYNLQGTIPARTPMDAAFRLVAFNESDAVSEYSDYRSLLGALLYISTATRPDIAFAVGFLARFQNKVNANHWEALVRILRYLYTTRSQKLVLGGTDSSLCGFVDSDWANDLWSRKSVTGYVILFGGPIHWCSKQQPITAGSSTEAEYLAAGEACKNLICIAQFARNFGIQIEAAVLKGDNVSAIKMAEAERNTSRVKHIDVRYHLIRELIAEKKISFQWVSGKQNYADELTKALVPHLHKQMLLNLRLRAREDVGM